ncbi:Sigma-70 region 2 [Streptomyces melanosporofaciens]|uniref:Sigma-70 region 2 n=1 Tax=Streptomyces melanosporofaciens TaxID=67327 RepID=A0A1H4YS22_STRMJ|nr:Sigma-70 region 2 [Streptomyces melanosporofaciens]
MPNRQPHRETPCRYAFPRGSSPPSSGKPQQLGEEPEPDEVLWNPGPGHGEPGAALDPFVAHRSLLFTVADEMLGSAADAQDVVQESWLRWADVDRSRVRDPRACLVRTVTRQTLNRLRTLSRRREEYVGEWLPEPLLTSPDVAEGVELAESVPMAMLTPRAGSPSTASRPR